MKELIKQIKILQSSEIKKTVDNRVSSFKVLGLKSSSDLFSELCFCILTANFSAERGIKIQQEIGNNFSELTEEKLANMLRILGHRFPNARANYIVNSRIHKDSLKQLQNTLSEQKYRDWLVDNIKGLGMKEASHFMRNIGYNDVAIIDFHIVDLLEKHKIIKKPKTITKKKYLEIEAILRSLAKKANLNLSELDLYLWYLETGKILK